MHQIKRSKWTLRCLLSMRDCSSAKLTRVQMRLKGHDNSLEFAIFFTFIIIIIIFVNVFFVD